MTPAQFRTERERLGFTQETVADMADLSLETVRDFEEGRPVDEDSISRMSKKLSFFKKENRNKQKIEMYYFEHFKQACGLKIETTYGDMPDVKVQLGTKIIGVEITSFYHESGGNLCSEQQQRKQRKQLVETAQKKYLERGGRNRELSINFNPKKPLYDKNRNENIASELADLAINSDSCTESGLIKFDFKNSLPEILSAYYNWENYAHPQWMVNQVNTTPHISENTILKIICEKERKAINYESYDELWLLIVIDPIDSAQDGEIPNNIPALFSKYSGIFNRVILFKLKNQIIDLIQQQPF